MKKMKRKIILIACLVLLAAAVIAMPASAGFNQGGNSGGCHGVHAGSQNCAENSYGSGQCNGYEYQNTVNNWFRNSEGYCLNNGTCTPAGTGSGSGNGCLGNCPCI
jgi:hypothetical protein